ncbi:single-stranded DNA-binding protein [Candidatus Margulisiibacteriota bacterium]
MYNKAFLIGNLTRDPELRYTASGIPVARFAIAVNRIKPKGASSEGGQDVDFINIIAWRRLAEICGEYLKKGRSVAIEGRLQIRDFQSKTGEKRTMTEVVADNMQMLGRREAPGGASSGQDATAAAGEPAADEGEIPF